ncbi:dihydroxyacetone kinase family protein [Georgenia deserti]|uniref:Dihydroxyacetone kinase family protein n=1 Tax=Georgenia deserti TaxID=2093781 RepID=A0ABW4L186_9MICO
MTHIFNDPAAFAEESLEGFVQLHADLVRQVPGGVVRRGRQRDGKVAIVLGGGSGHYPMFAGFVGPGLADGAVVGNIFTSPSAQWAYTVARHADRGGGVVFCYGNYAGDVLNFGSATERLQGEGIAAANLIVHDDVLSAPPTERERRRGLAGDFVVARVLAGAADAGRSLEEVVSVGGRANDRTRTVGVAFGGCTFPGAHEPLFEVPAGQMAIGMGAHGEPGLENVPALSSDELARTLLDHIAADVPEDAGERVAVVVNGMGATKQEELFLFWRDLAPLIADRGWTPVEPEVGEIITSLNMEGLSLTLTWLDDELEQYWTAPAYGPGYRKGSVAGLRASADDMADTDLAIEAVIPDASAASREAAETATQLLAAALEAVRDAETDLGDADAVAGDGDHGRGMVRGLGAALEAMSAAVSRGAGLKAALGLAGDAWAERAGGTSGALWGAATRAFGTQFDETGTPTAEQVVAGAEAFRDCIARLGRVSVGDKSMLDAIAPATETFVEAVGRGVPLGAAVQSAATAADDAARATADLSPRVGRARPLAERSVGHPDPGALSYALVVGSLARALEAGDD